jgi:hypothetical protein
MEKKEQGAINPDLSPQQEAMHIAQMKNTYRAQMRAASLDDPRSAHAEASLHHVINSFLYRGDGRPEMVDELNSFLVDLITNASYGSSVDPMRSRSIEEITAVLRGAGLALQMRRSEMKRPLEISDKDKESLEAFLRLVHDRVGTIDKDGNVSFA